MLDPKKKNLGVYSNLTPSKLSKHLTHTEKKTIKPTLLV